MVKFDVPATGIGSVQQVVVENVKCSFDALHSDIDLICCGPARDSICYICNLHYGLAMIGEFLGFISTPLADE